jgi:hypothetical protein
MSLSRKVERLLDPEKSGNHHATPEESQCKILTNAVSHADPG